MGIGRPRATEQAGTISGEIVTATEDDLTYYVRTTGNDSNDGLSEGAALLTAQVAINKVPKYIGHDVVLDLGEGDMGPLHIEMFTIGSSGSLTVQGVLGQPTITSGLLTGTATGGSTTQLIDTTGPAWTVNDLRGHLVLVGGEYRIVRNNTADTINFIGPYAATCSGKAYEILEQKTEFTGTSLRGLGPLSFSHITTNLANFIVKDVKTSSGTVGAYGGHCQEFQLERIKITGSVYGLYSISARTIKFLDIYLADNSVYGCLLTMLLAVNGAERIYAYNCGTGLAFYNSLFLGIDYMYADNNTTGITISATNQAATPYVYVDSNTGEGLIGESVGFLNFGEIESTNNGGDGLRLWDVKDTDLSSGSISENGEYGIRIGDDDTIGSRQFVEATGTITIENNTLGGIFIWDGSGIRLTDTSGTNTGAYGIEVTNGAYAMVDSTTDITGATADATIDGGSTALTWATDFASDGDIVINDANLSRIERKD